MKRPDLWLALGTVISKQTRTINKASQRPAKRVRVMIVIEANTPPATQSNGQ